MRSWLNWLLLAYCLAGTAASAEEPTEAVHRAEPPKWVTAPDLVEVDAESEDGGFHYRLVDYQHHLETAQQYQQIVVSILSEAGVKEFSQLALDYQPEYESLTLHHVTIERDGMVEERLDRASIETLRREEDMDQQFYNGELTVLIILEDVRPGDVLSYAYTRTGANPVHKGHVHGFLRLGFNNPIDYLRRRVLWDAAARELAWQVLGGQADDPDDPVPGNAGGLRELRWDQKHAPRIRPEKNTPGSHFDYPWLEYADYGDWGAFGQSALHLYGQDASLPEELDEVCSAIRTESASEEEQIVATLRWVQRNVRYLGSFFGEHTHAPYPIDEVYRRRFGDCKDKSMMTVAMLKHLGFDAAPALVNTAGRRVVKDYLPGHGAFDHLLVHLKWRDDDYLLDPTYTYQRGPLNELHTPDYGFAFVVRPGTEALVPVGPQGFEVDQTTITETYVVPTKYDGAELAVRTVATGGDANGLRRTRATNTLEYFEETYLEFYAADFPGIELAEPIKFTDDEANNRIEIEERYRIPTFWKANEKQTKWTAEVGARFLKNSLHYPTEGVRRHPFAHEFPKRIHQVIEVRLPETWNIKVGNVEIDHPAFTYRSSLELLDKGMRVRMDHFYESLAAEVQPDDFSTFTAAMDRLADDTSINIFHSGDQSNIGTANDGNESPFALALLAGAASIGLLLGAVAAILLYFWDPPERKVEPAAPRGLAGWLILPIIGCCLLPLVVLNEGASYFRNLGDMGEVLETEAGFAGWRLYYFLGVLFAGLIFPLTIIQLVLLFNKRSSFPYFYIALILVLLVADGTLLGLENNLEGIEESDSRGEHVAREMFSLLLWGTYMIRSRRVKVTFVRRRAASPAPALPPPLPPPLPIPAATLASTRAGNETSRAPVEPGP